MPLSFASLIGFAAFALNLLLVVKIIFQPAEDSVAKYVLVGLLVALAAMIATHLYNITQLYMVYPHFAGSTLIFTYSIAPLLYLYVQRLTTGAAPLEQRFWYLHWLIPLALVIYVLPFYRLDAAAKVTRMLNSPSPFTLSLISLGYYLQILVYIYYCSKTLVTYEANIRSNFSDIERINLNWVNRLCRGLVLLILLDVALPFVGFISTPLYHVFLTANALLIIVLAYSALGQSQLQLPPAISRGEDDDNNDVDAAGKYSRSGLRSDTAQYYLDKLVNQMAEEQWFLEESLSLGVLAERLNMSAHHLSQLLNEHMDTAFYDYINEQRVNFAKHLLLASPDQSIIDVAYASGYSSKSTFYTVFKRQVGLTPAQYRRQNAGVVKNIPEKSTV